LLSFPSPDQGVWHLGPIPIRAYALFIIAGIILAVWWSERRWVARGGESGTITDVAVFAVPFGLVGGRLYHVITDYWRYFGPGKNPIDALKVWDGGLGIWGAVALGGVGAWIACRRHKVPLPAIADAIAPGLITAQAIGRIGNYFNQELYGGHTTLPWAMEIYQRIDPATGATDPLGGVAIGHHQLADSPVHPTFLYELLWNLLIAAIVVWADKKFRLGHGRAFAVYVAGYTLGRFWIELMRDDPATHVFGVRVNVWVAAIVFLGAVAYLLAMRGKQREDIAGLSTKGEAEVPEGDEKAHQNWEPAADSGRDTDSGGDAASDAGSEIDPAKAVNEDKTQS
jgi:prolipoprotein diacylglyceryl transferase